MDQLTAADIATRERMVGAVLANAVYDFDGDLKTITFGGGRTWKLPAYFHTPRSNHANEAFKILNGSFRYIEMTFIETPFGMRAAWSGRIRFGPERRAFPAGCHREAAWAQTGTDEASDQGAGDRSRRAEADG